MPIVIDRHTGEIISVPEITQERTNAAWETLVSNWLQKHPEVFKEMITNTDPNGE